MAESGVFSGQYQSRDGVRCDYEVEWQRSWRLVTWAARVHMSDDTDAVLRSVTANVAPADDPTDAVSADVHERIEESLPQRTPGLPRQAEATPAGRRRPS